MSEIVKTLLTASVSIFNRKNIKKFFAGEIEISEDELKKGEEDIQKLTDKYVKLTEEKYEKKCKEIMTI